MDDYLRFSSDDFEDPLSNYDPPQYTSELEWALAEETAEAIACKPYLLIRPDAKIRQAIQVMSEARTACLLFDFVERYFNS